MDDHSWKLWCWYRDTKEDALNPVTPCSDCPCEQPRASMYEIEGRIVCSECYRELGGIVRLGF